MILKLEHSLILCNNHKVYGSGRNYHYQLGFKHNNGIKSFTLINDYRLQFVNKINVSRNTSFFLLKSGHVYSCGMNEEYWITGLVVKILKRNMDYH